MVLLIIVGTLPLFLVLPIKDRVEALGNNPIFVCGALLLTGCILFLSDQMARGHKTVRSATLLDVFLVGLAQGLATIPGLSRSGCTISAGMVRGFDRKFAVRYSFLMSLPAVLGATLLEVVDVMKLEGASRRRTCPNICWAWLWPRWWASSPSTWCGCWLTGAGSAPLPSTAGGRARCLSC